MTSVATTIAQRLLAARAEIAAACERADRDPASVTLIGVTKTHGVDVVETALAAGLSDLGENRAQELVPKASEAAASGLQPRWHFIGHLQRNKVRDVLPHIAALHSLDSERLMQAVATRAAAPVPCYIEVNVSGEETKDGIAPAALAALLRAATQHPRIEIAGLMTIAPLTDDAEPARPVFRALREVAQAHGLTGLSMGMTNDYAVAIEEGATVVRVGRAIFGERAE